MDDTPDEFIYYCYNWILGRNPDPDGKEHYIKLLNTSISKHEILISFLNSDEYAERLNSLMNPTIKFAPPGHFYSSLPNINDIKKLYQKKSINPETRWG